MAEVSSLRRRWRWVVLGASLAMAAYIWVWHSPDLSAFRHWAEETSHHPLVVTSVILVMAVTLAIGLPGSIGLWLIAPFYPPHVATPMLIFGSVLGALGAYRLAALAGDRWQPKGLTRKVMLMLEARSDLLTQCALRVLPGFPHSVINFAAGLRRLPLGTFLLAATLGLGIKWAVYASAIYSGLDAIANDESFLSADILLPLVALTLLLLLGSWMRRRVEEEREV